METKSAALMAQIGYMLDHPGTMGELAAYMKRLEDRNRALESAHAAIAKRPDTVTLREIGGRESQIQVGAGACCPVATPGYDRCRFYFEAEERGEIKRLP